MPVQDRSLASKGMGAILPELDAGGALPLLSLDQFKVVEGVFERETINSPNDLIVGDVFRLPKSDDQLHADGFSDVEESSIEVLTSYTFGPSHFIANVTHSVIFLSETGKRLNGYVLDGSRSATDRPSIIFGGETCAATNYVLIEITEGRNTTDWFAFKSPGVAEASLTTPQNASAAQDQEA